MLFGNVFVLEELKPVKPNDFTMQAAAHIATE